MLTFQNDIFFLAGWFGGFFVHCLTSFSMLTWRDFTDCCCSGVVMEQTTEKTPDTWEVLSHTPCTL